MLRSSPPESQELPQEEVWTHKQLETKEETKISRCLFVCFFFQYMFSFVYAPGFFLTLFCVGKKNKEKPKDKTKK